MKIWANTEAVEFIEINDRGPLNSLVWVHGRIRYILPNFTVKYLEFGGWGPKVWTTKNQNGLNLKNKNYERLNVERPLLPTTFNARDQKFERLKWREVKN